MKNNWIETDYTKISAKIFIENKTRHILVFLGEKQEEGQWQTEKKTCLRICSDDGF